MRKLASLFVVFTLGACAVEDAVVQNGQALSLFPIGQPEGVCPEGQSQDWACLDANGGISWDGILDDAMARQLRDNGTCLCQGSGTTPTIPDSEKP